MAASTECSPPKKETTDFKPMVELLDPCGAGTWLLTELDPEDEDRTFALCDLGTGFSELDASVTPNPRAMIETMPSRPI